MPVLYFPPASRDSPFNHTYERILENHFVRVRHQLDRIEVFLCRCVPTDNCADGNILEDCGEQLSPFHVIFLLERNHNTSTGMPVAPGRATLTLSDCGRLADDTPGTGSVSSQNVVLDFDSNISECSDYVHFTAVDQCTRSQVSVLICFSFSFGEFVRTIIVSLLPDTWNSRMRFLPTSAAASAPSR